jgi:hypothetical protein
MRPLDRSRNGQVIIANAREEKCVFIPKGKIYPCGEPATSFFLFEKQWPVCFCKEHEKEKFGAEERVFLQEKIEPCTKSEFEAAVFLAG